eukprot:SAG31_NODE_339_length_17487_cov_20.764435_11_plen_262_part_00
MQSACLMVSSGGSWNIAGLCYMRGQVDLEKPTRKANVTACVVRTRPSPPQPAPSGALNVLYMVSDDARPELPNYGQNYVSAPNLAALARRGLTFMHAYCQQSICSPSRNSFLSGRKTQVTKVWNFVVSCVSDAPNSSPPQFAAVAVVRVFWCSARADSSSVCPRCRTISGKSCPLLSRFRSTSNSTAIQSLVTPSSIIRITHPTTTSHFLGHRFLQMPTLRTAISRSTTIRVTAQVHSAVHRTRIRTNHRRADILTFAPAT